MQDAYESCIYIRLNFYAATTDEMFFDKYSYPRYNRIISRMVAGIKTVSPNKKKITVSSKAPEIISSTPVTFESWPIPS